MSANAEVITAQRKIANGSYGIVFQVTNINGETSAMKILPGPLTDGIDCLLEVHIMSSIRHPNLAWIKQIITSQTCPNITGIAWTLPLADATLEQWLSSTSFTLQHRFATFYKTCCALECLHRHNIIHLDIKANNVVMLGRPEDAYPLLIDFGLAMAVDDLKTGKKFEDMAVTIDYRPPEIIKGVRVYNQAVDVWSMGIMLLSLLKGSTFIPVQLQYSQGHPECVLEYLAKELKTETDALRRDNIVKEMGLIRSCEDAAKRNVQNLSEVNTSITAMVEKVNKYREEDVLRYIMSALDPSNIGNTVMVITSDMDQSVRGMVLEVLKGMLALNPAERWTITQVLNHPLFAPYADPVLRQDASIHDPNELSKSIDYSVVNDTFREYLKVLLLIFKECGDVSMETFYLAVDLTYRSTPLIKDMKDDSIRKSCGLIFVTCMVMALKLTHQHYRHYSIDNNVNVWNHKCSLSIKSIDVVACESRIIEMLYGNLYRPYLYHEIANRGEVIDIVPGFIINRDTYMYYGKFTAKEVVDRFRPSEDTSPKQMLVSEME